MDTPQKPSCWNCKYQQIGGDTFFGLCKYFEVLNCKAVEIPIHVVDVGCQFHEMRELSE
jgi:hypothetical protein